MGNMRDSSIQIAFFEGDDQDVGSGHYSCQRVWVYLTTNGRLFVTTKWRTYNHYGQHVPSGPAETRYMSEWRVRRLLTRIGVRAPALVITPDKPPSDLAPIFAKPFRRWKRGEKQRALRWMFADVSA